MMSSSVKDDSLDLRYLGMSHAQFILMCEKACPFIKDFLNLKTLYLNRGHLTMLLPYKNEFVGNPVTKVLHGGVTASLIDHVGGFCAMSLLPGESNVLLINNFHLSYQYTILVIHQP